jgi:2-amino-4-hydroxy-6-hydroxymethyldihydropteridine diphosphokinase
VRAYLGLGSNLGNRIGYLRRAVATLREIDACLTVSPVYETAPVGGPAQGPYLNCVVRLDTELDPFELLQVAWRLESDARRIRTVRNGPRTLDVDILVIEGLELATPELTVPHPRMSERVFVLAPLEDLDATLVPPRWRETFGASLGVPESARKVGSIDDSLG